MKATFVGTIVAFSFLFSSASAAVPNASAGGGETSLLPKGGQVGGVVMDAATKQPLQVQYIIAGVDVKKSRLTDIRVGTTAPDGKFWETELEDGYYAVAVLSPAYRDFTRPNHFLVELAARITSAVFGGKLYIMAVGPVYLNEQTVINDIEFALVR